MSGYDPGQLDRLDSICDLFDAQWRTTIPPQIEQFLPRVEDRDQAALLRELLLIECEYRRCRGEQPTVDEYTARFPRFADAVQGVFGDVESKSLGDELFPLTTIVSPHAAPGPSAELKRVGPYELVELLGRGGFGEVWLGRRSGALATTHVAVKIPSGNAAAQLVQNEAQTWVRASGHANVVPIIEADVYDGTVAIVSEYVSGGTLADLLARQLERRLFVADAVEITIGILTGLEYLHARGIIHRDLKPGNVLMQHGIPRLTDFGLAGTFEEGGGHSAVAGTLAYMAPEVFAGRPSVQSDLWAVGVVFYQMLCGTLPFRPSAQGPLGWGSRPVDPPTALNDVSAEIRKVLTRSFRENPDERFRSAAEMRSALAAARRLLSAGRQDPPDRLNAPACRVIAVTGSMDADADSLRRRLPAILGPFVGPLTTWYTGTVGAVDESVVEYLVERRQHQLYLVGYSAMDLSPAMQVLATTHDIPFINAESEVVPSLPEAPHQRDAYFVSKADLVVVIWNRKSEGTRRLLTWLEHEERDHITIYL